MNTYPKFKVFTSDDPSKLDREESLILKESTYFPKDKTAKIIALKSLKSRILRIYLLQIIYPVMNAKNIIF
ncbi:hypothetical protein [Candidatus Endomicrobiellum trichonymphae]|uniref:hypothetical protein n=1 Tax=Endomicrobium trichonymphae TaxID=1408204 RepID=UPI000BBB39B0|nr:hypothetical protein [Candidatus Endomicrobium trichonymphae]